MSVNALATNRLVAIFLVAGAVANALYRRQAMEKCRQSYLNVQSCRQSFIAAQTDLEKMDSRLKHLERKQKLYSLLKEQHDAEVKELMHYMSVLTTVENDLVRSYLHTLLSDGLRHIEYISRVMAGIEGATRSASLTKKGIQESIEDERDSRDTLVKCAKMSDDPETAALLTSISVDEEHHMRILQHLSELVESYSK